MRLNLKYKHKSNILIKFFRNVMGYILTYILLFTKKVVVCA